MARPLIAEGGNGLQVHLLAADKCGPFSCGLEQVKKSANYEVCFGHGRIVWNDKWRTVVSTVMNRCGS
jgi:hypothetical protein